MCSTVEKDGSFKKTPVFYGLGYTNHYKEVEIGILLCVMEFVLKLLGPLFFLDWSLAHVLVHDFLNAWLVLQSFHHRILRLRQLSLD